jgi:hypothetical protein
MAAGHGGARVGAGRPPGSKTRKTDTPDEGVNRYVDALTYLEAVVRGDEPADGLRIAAAKVVLPYQAPKQRAPVESPPPKALRAQQTRSTEADINTDWSRRAEEVRKRLAKGKKTQ